MNKPRTEHLDVLFPETGGLDFLENFWLKKMSIQHGALSRLPDFMQSPDGAIAGLHCLENWRKDDNFDFTVLDDKDFTQFRTKALSPNILYRLGAAIQLTDLHLRIPDLHTWVTEVCGELGVEMRYVSVNGWFSHQNRGLGMHYDPGEVILIQLVGNKKLRIAGNQFTAMPDVQYQIDKPTSRCALSLYDQGYPETEPIETTTIELNPGSVFFIPRGVWHDSEAMNTDSVALAIYIRTRTVADLISSYLRDCLRQNLKYRMPLIGLDKKNSESAAALIEESLNTLVTDIGNIDAEQVITHNLPLLNRTYLPDNLTYTLQRLPATSLSIKPKDSEKIIAVIRSRLSEKDTKLSEVELDLDTKVTLEWIRQSSSRFTLDQLSAASPGLDICYLKGLVEVLLETNYLVLVPFGLTDPLETP